MLAFFPFTIMQATSIRIYVQVGNRGRGWRGLDAGTEGSGERGGSGARVASENK